MFPYWFNLSIFKVAKKVFMVKPKYFDTFVQDSQLVQFACKNSNQQESMVRELEGKSGEKNFFLADPGNRGKTTKRIKNVIWVKREKVMIIVAKKWEPGNLVPSRFSG